MERIQPKAGCSIDISARCTDPGDVRLNYELSILGLITNCRGVSSRLPNYSVWEPRKVLGP
jgi:hypothetical protein